MKLEWVPPPGWPPPPHPGWSPPPGWQPDAAWPAPPSNWQYWQPVAVARASARTRTFSVVSAAGALLAIIGAFGSWITLSAPLIHESSSGFQAGHDGPFVLGFALVALGIAVPRLAGVRLPLWSDILGIVAGGVLVAICAADTADVHQRMDNLRTIFPVVSGGVGSGLKLALVGSIVALAGAAGALNVRRRVASASFVAPHGSGSA